MISKDESFIMAYKYVINSIRYNYNVSEELSNTIDELLSSNDLDNCIIAYTMLLSCDINL